MKTITTVVLFASILNVLSFVDKCINSNPAITHTYSYDALANGKPTVRHIVVSDSFSGTRSPAIVSNR